MTFLITILVLLVLIAPTMIWRYIVRNGVSDTEDAWIEGALIGCGFWMAMLIAGVAYNAIDEYKHPDPTFTLYKADWQCTQSHTERRLVGKIISNVSVCDEYERTK